MWSLLYFWVEFRIPWREDSPTGPSSIGRSTIQGPWRGNQPQVLLASYKRGPVLLVNRHFFSTIGGGILWCLVTQGIGVDCVPQWLRSTCETLSARILLFTDNHPFSHLKGLLFFCLRSFLSCCEIYYFYRFPYFNDPYLPGWPFSSFWYMLMLCRR